MNSKINIMNIVNGTSTNIEGLKLYIYIKNNIKSPENQLIISFAGSTAPSPSFLNSSFGSLIEEIGIDQFRASVKFVELTKNQAGVLNKYFTDLRDLSKA